MDTHCLPQARQRSAAAAGSARWNRPSGRFGLRPILPASPHRPSISDSPPAYPPAAAFGRPYPSNKKSPLPRVPQGRGEYLFYP